MINLFNLKNEILGWIAALSAIMLTIFTAFMRGKSQGKQQAEAKQNEQQLEAIITVQKRIHEAGYVSNDDVRDSLRKNEF
jgi:hypothetical protein